MGDLADNKVEWVAKGPRQKHVKEELDRLTDAGEGAVQLVIRMPRPAGLDRESQKGTSPKVPEGDWFGPRPDEASGGHVRVRWIDQRFF